MAISHIANALGIFGRGASRVARPLRPLGNASLSGAKKGLRGADATGKFIAKHPKGSLSALLVGGYGAGQLKKNVNKQMSHVDPEQKNTVAGPISGIRFRSKRHEDYLKRRNMLY